jgi:hypothetical protein
VEAAEVEEARAVSMAGYLSRRTGGAGSTPFGPHWSILSLPCEAR